MNGHEIKVTCGGNVTLDAVYGQQTSITAEKGMKLGLFKGSLEVRILSAFIPLPTFTSYEGECNIRRNYCIWNRWFVSSCE